MIKYRISEFLNKIGLHKPVRTIYNYLFLFGKKSKINFEDITVVFRTPTFTILEDVNSLLGEKEVLSFFLNELRDDDVVWDIGASYGIYSLFTSKKISTGKVFSFEPEIQTYKLLKKNIQLNNCQNIIPLCFALSNADGRGYLHLSNSANVGTHSLVARDDFPVSKNGKTVIIHTGDSVVQNGVACLPNVVKIDVEGAEINVLEGMKEILSTPKLRLVQIELHQNILPLFNKSVADLMALMSVSGFSLISERKRGTEVELIFNRPSVRL